MESIKSPEEPRCDMPVAEESAEVHDTEIEPFTLNANEEIDKTAVDANKCIVLEEYEHLDNNGMKGDVDVDNAIDKEEIIKERSEEDLEEEPEEEEEDESEDIDESEDEDSDESNEEEKKGSVHEEHRELQPAHVVLHTPLDKNAHGLNGNNELQGKDAINTQDSNKLLDKLRKLANLRDNSEAQGDDACVTQNDTNKEDKVDEVIASSTDTDQPISAVSSGVKNDHAASSLAHDYVVFDMENEDLLLQSAGVAALKQIESHLHKLLECVHSNLEHKEELQRQYHFYTTSNDNSTDKNNNSSQNNAVMKTEEAQELGEKQVEEKEPVNSSFTTDNMRMIEWSVNGSALLHLLPIHDQANAIDAFLSKLAGICYHFGSPNAMLKAISLCHEREINADAVVESAFAMLSELTLHGSIVTDRNAFQRFTRDRKHAMTPEWRDSYVNVIRTLICCFQAEPTRMTTKYGVLFAQLVEYASVHEGLLRMCRDRIKMESLIQLIKNLPKDGEDEEMKNEASDTTVVAHMNAHPLVRPLWKSSTNINSVNYYNQQQHHHHHHHHQYEHLNPHYKTMTTAAAATADYDVRPHDRSFHQGRGRRAANGHTTTTTTKTTAAAAAISPSLLTPRRQPSLPLSSRRSQNRRAMRGTRSSGRASLLEPHREVLSARLRSGREKGYDTTNMTTITAKQSPRVALNVDDSKNEQELSATEEECYNKVPLHHTPMTNATYHTPRGLISRREISTIRAMATPRSSEGIHRLSSYQIQVHQPNQMADNVAHTNVNSNNNTTNAIISNNMNQRFVTVGGAALPLREGRLHSLQRVQSRPSSPARGHIIQASELHELITRSSSARNRYSSNNNKITSATANTYEARKRVQVTRNGVITQNGYDASHIQNSSLQKQQQQEQEQQQEQPNILKRQSANALHPQHTNNAMNESEKSKIAEATPETITLHKKQSKVSNTDVHFSNGTNGASAVKRSIEYARLKVENEPVLSPSSGSSKVKRFLTSEGASSSVINPSRAMHSTASESPHDVSVLMAAVGANVNADNVTVML